MTAPEWNLLEKSELRIERVRLDGADLSVVAATVADELGVPHDEVIVIDARDDLLALDILRRTIDPYVLVGRREALLNALGQIAGVHVSEETDMCSEGMLGWISADATEATAALDRSREMVAEIESRIASRAIVFSTGPEVITGQIRDTNKPWIIHRLQEGGFAAMPGEDLPDDGDTIAAAIREAVEDRGYGLVVTTGGVGAEGKDGTVEALLSIDSDAATPAIFEVEAGQGRHVKPRVCIGVGTVGAAVIACLPGPHVEARFGVEALLAGLAGGADKYGIAEGIAATLRQRLRRMHTR